MLTTLYSWYGKTTVRIVLAVIVILIVLGAVLGALRGSGETNTAQETAPRAVHTASVAELASGGSSVSIIGTVESVSEADVRAESGGRITSVSVSIGDRVRAGSVLATFENSSQRASVLSAQGSYEAALAAAAQSEVTSGASAEDVARAQTTAWSAYRSAFISLDSIMRNTLDPLFEGYNYTALRLIDFSWERRLIRYDLEDWGKASLGAAPSNITPSLTEGEALITRFETLLDDMYAHIIRQERESTKAIIDAYKVELSTARTELNSARTSLVSARAALESTEAAYERAQIAGSGGEVSAADAQVKQALGSLRLAQAALAKTIVRAPIDGVVNTVHVSTGEFVSMGSPVALVLNNSALVITAYLSETDRSRIDIGSTVTIEGGFEGTVTNIAPSIDRVTQKYEVKINPSTTELANGDVVHITLGDAAIEQADAEGAPTTVARLPLRAFKLTPDGAVVFTVSEESTLVAHTVELGEITGDSAVLTTPLDPSLEIVTDARGLKDGMQVVIAETAA